MNDFTASNGITLTIAPEGHIILPPATMGIGEESQQALREFFQAEADERLGRWRWPENPDYVVYPLDEYGQTVVVNEATGHNVTFTRGNVNPWGSEFAKCAIAFFDAHPEPKPWHDAGPAEVWDVDLPSGGMRAVTVYSARHEEPITVFRDAHTQVEIETDDPIIRDARRVFPDVAS